MKSKNDWVYLSDDNGTMEVLHTLWDIDFELMIIDMKIKAINDGTYKEEQSPIKFTTKTCRELAQTMEHIREHMNDLEKILAEYESNK